MNRANQILTLGNLIQKTPRAELVRKGAETAIMPGGRVEATKSQNHMQAKVMKKQKLWVNRKLPGSKQRVKQMPGAGEHLAVRWWREQQSPELLWLPRAPPCVYLTPHPPFFRWLKWIWISQSKEQNLNSRIDLAPHFSFSLTRHMAWGKGVNLSQSQTPHRLY